jgi:hypothetical protein
VRWWKTKTNNLGVTRREKNSSEKVIDIITVEKDKDAIYSNQYIMNKIRNKIGISSIAKVDIVIIETIKETSLGISNDVY